MGNKVYKLGLHWMRNDMRVVDNEALVLLANKCERILVVYIFDPNWRTVNQFGHCHLGVHRQAFLEKSLVDVGEQLLKYNIPMLSLEGEPTAIISNFVKHHSVDCISYEEHYGYNERKEVSLLEAKLPSISFISGSSNYLLIHNDLPFTIDDMPDVFSPFRNKVEKKLNIKLASVKLNKFDDENLKLPAVDGLHMYEPAALVQVSEYDAGQSAAIARINNYFFKTNGVASYKETRNGFDGWNFSSRLSAYLSLGCISPAYVFRELQVYEQTHIKNESTYWLFFELLWREFFHLQARKHGTNLFNYGGIQQRPPTNVNNDATFTMWKSGETPYPIVNACMNQLFETGFMSNRGRQLVASCFVHELQQDWRYGAAYFEEMLIDFDVASNFGNWQYLAGVGADPRGHRKFDLEKQSNFYDPQRIFIKTWT